METETELDALPSQELHDLAVRRALHHADVAFFWELLRAIPAAEALDGDVREAGEDATKLSALASDALTLGEHLRRVLQPLGLDYQVKDGFLMITSKESIDAPVGTDADLYLRYRDVLR